MGAFVVSGTATKESHERSWLSATNVPAPIVDRPGMGEVSVEQQQQQQQQQQQTFATNQEVTESSYSEHHEELGDEEADTFHSRNSVEGTAADILQQQTSDPRNEIIMTAEATAVRHQPLETDPNIDHANAAERNSNEEVVHDDRVVAPPVEPSQPPQPSSSTRRPPLLPHQDPYALIMIDVAKGLQVPLRRVREVQTALTKDFYMTSACPHCTRKIAVIANAAFVACPLCDTISPLQGDIVPVGQTFRIEPAHRRHGLGLGMTWQTMKQVHEELYPRARPPQSHPPHRGY